VLKAVTNRKVVKCSFPTVELEAIGNKSFDDCLQLNKDFICFHRMTQVYPRKLAASFAAILLAWAAFLAINHLLCKLPAVPTRTAENK